MLSIAWKDLQVLVKDRNAMVGAFRLPIIFVVVSRQQVPRPRLAA